MCVTGCTSRTTAGRWSRCSSGERGETYNVGGRNEWRNIDIVKLLCRLVDQASRPIPDSAAGSLAPRPAWAGRLKS